MAAVMESGLRRWAWCGARSRASCGGVRVTMGVQFSMAAHQNLAGLPAPLPVLRSLSWEETFPGKCLPRGGHP